MSLIGNMEEAGYWSSSVVSQIYGWAQGFHNGHGSRVLRIKPYYVRCVAGNKTISFTSKNGNFCNDLHGFTPNFLTTSPSPNFNY